MSVENNPIEWVRIAESDFSSAHHLFKTHYPKPLEIVSFHSQQAAEKMLKCYLVMQNVEFPKTHDLQKLGELCEETNKDFKELRSSIIILNRYSIIPRYPNELQIEEEDAISALENADKVMVFVKGFLSEQQA